MRNGSDVHHCFGDVDVDVSNLRVTVAGEVRPLEPKSFRLLQFLIDNRGRAVPKEEILAAVWPETFVTDNALTRAVAQIRKALGDDAREPRYIETVPTIGYRFLPELAPPSNTVDTALPPAPPIAQRSQPPRLALAILALTAIVVVGWEVSQRVGGGGSQEPTPLQLTSVPGLAIGGSFNPDGNALAFSSNRNGWFEIYTRPAETRGTETQITSDGKQNIEPAWSPDGKTIAYHSVARRGIWAISASGGTPRQLAPFGASPAWSPDGKRIAFRSSEPFSFAWVDWGSAAESTIWVVGADGSDLRQLTIAQNPPGTHVDPAWSPDGSRVVFIAMRPGPQGIAFNNLWIADAHTGALAHIPTGHLADQASPQFGADGGEIYLVGADLPDNGYALISSGRDVELFSKFVLGIYKVPADGSSAPSLVYRTRQHTPGRISPAHDGRRMLYSQAEPVSQIWVSGSGRQDARPLYQDPVIRAFQPSYSPDGQKLAYAVQADGSNKSIWMMGADGSHPAVLTTEHGIANSVDWGRDGSSVYYAYYEKRLQIRRIRLADRSTEVLLDSPAALLRVHVTPDEHDVVYDFGRPLNIWTRPLQGGPPRQLTFEKEGASFPVISRDGRWISYEVNRGDDTQVAVMDRKSGQHRILTDRPGQNFCSGWTPDSRRVLCAGYFEGVWNIETIDRETGERKVITGFTAFGSFVRGPTWRPGTDQVAYEYMDVKGNIYLLDLARAGR